MIQMNVEDALNPEENIGKEDKNETMQSDGEALESASSVESDWESKEREIIIDLDEEDQKVVDWSKDLNALEANRREWIWAELGEDKGLDEQIALLEDVLEWDKSEVQTMHEYRSASGFYALVTSKEAAKLFDSGMIRSACFWRPPRMMQEKKRMRRDEIRRKVEARRKNKKQKISMGMPHLINLCALQSFCFSPTQII